MNEELESQLEEKRHSRVKLIVGDANERNFELEEPSDGPTPMSSLTQI